MPARVTDGALTENDALLLLQPRFEHATDGRRLLRYGTRLSAEKTRKGKKMRGVQRGEHEELVEGWKGRSEPQGLTGIRCR